VQGRVHNTQTFLQTKREFLGRGFHGNRVKDLKPL